MDDEKSDAEETDAPAHKHEHEGDFAAGQETKEHDADETRGSFATGESEGPGVPLAAKKGFFAEGEADEESEKNEHKGTFAEGEDDKS